MKITDNRRAIILTETGSPYFEQGIFVLKENVVKEEEKLLNEARGVAERYAKKCETGKTLVKIKSKNTLKCVISAAVGGAIGAGLMLVLNFV